MPRIDHIDRLAMPCPVPLGSTLSCIWHGVRRDREIQAMDQILRNARVPIDTIRRPRLSPLRFSDVLEDLDRVIDAPD